MTLFLESIWRLANAEYPELNVFNPKAINASASQYWVYMRHPGYTLMYKTYKKSGSFTDCVVDLELAGRGDDVEQLREQYKGALAGTTIAGTTISVQKTGKSASFRVQVPRIVPPQFDEEKVREALGAASKLKAWWEAIGAAR